VAAAVDRLPQLVAEATNGTVNPERVVLAGHSAGGHLALWAASRHQLPESSRWHGGRSSAIGVVALAAVSDLVACYRRDLGDQAAGALIGGGFLQFPERYREVDPMRLVPAGVPVRLVHGTADDRVPYDMSLNYSLQARVAGAAAAEATCVLLPGTGHFEVIDPLSSEWPQVVEAFRHVAGQPVSLASPDPGSL
jgi:acetyl esterase/lipase